MFCSICAPLILFYKTNLNWHFGRLLCKLGVGLEIANVLVSTFSMTSIAVDRWQFIVHSGRDRTKKFCLFFSILFIWIVALVLSMPLMMAKEEITFVLKSTNEVLYRICDETWHDRTVKYVYCSVIALFQYILPLIIIGW